MVESVGPDVADLAPGDFVILNWRAVCGTCRACRRGRPWYCFATFNATQKMTLADGTPLTPALGIGAFAEQTLVAVGPGDEGRRAREARDRRAARLRRDGRARRGDAHRRRRAAATAWRCSGAAAWATRRSPARGSPARTRSSASTSTTGSSRSAREFGATHTVNSRDDRPGRGDPRAHRRVRRRRVHRGGRAARGARAGVLRPRPRRHRRAGRGARPVDDHRVADDRVLRSRRRAQAVVVRRLPAVARLPDAHRPVPRGPPRPRPVRERDDRPRRRRGGVRTRWSAARCCARSSSSDTAAFGVDAARLWLVPDAERVSWCGTRPRWAVHGHCRPGSG